MSNFPIYHCLCKKCGYGWNPIGRDWPAKCPSYQSKKWSSGPWINPKLKLSEKVKSVPIPVGLKFKVRRQEVNRC